VTSLVKEGVDVFFTVRVSSQDAEEDAQFDDRVEGPPSVAGHAPSVSAGSEEDHGVSPQLKISLVAMGYDVLEILGYLDVVFQSIALVFSEFGFNRVENDVLIVFDEGDRELSLLAVRIGDDSHDW
jgi:hypothetical protein